MRFIRQFIADLLCTLGCQETLCIMESVVAGFRCMPNVNLLCSLVIVRSR
jgi:hypothetical protein